MAHHYLIVRSCGSAAVVVVFIYLIVVNENS
jgi:hypothetical protein